MGLKYRDPNTGSFKELTIKASDTLPIGSMVPYGNVNPPTGWLVCDGRAISRTVYADLFAVIGTSYGEGDGTTTFNLPNKKGRVSAGYDNANSKFDAIGKKLGEETHTMSVAELATHTHHFTSGVASVIGNGISTDAITDHSPSTDGLGATDLTTTGNSQPFNIIQPTEVDQWIIKAFQSIGVVAKVAQTETENNTDVYSCEYINNKLSNLSKTSIETGDIPPLNPSDGDLWIDTSDTANLAEVDNTVSTTSENAIANKAITNYVNGSIIFQSDDGQLDNIILNNSVANYHSIEIEYLKGTTFGVQKIINPNGKKVTLQLNNWYGTNFLQQIFKNININGNSITHLYGGFVNFNVENNTVTLGKENEIKITKVIGYKEI